MVYVTSDIHGRKEEFNELLKQIYFSENDEIFVLGDVLDRGKESISLLIQIMNTKNIHLLMGNHELYAILSLDEFNNIDGYDKQKIMNSWSLNGGFDTATEYKSLDKQRRVDLLTFLKKLKYFENITVNNQDYILAHSYMPVLDDESNTSYFNNLKNMIRIDYEKEYFKGKIFISGHTPSHYIDVNYRNKIFKNSYNINVDCGEHTLACLCLNNFNEYYVSVQV